MIIFSMGIPFWRGPGGYSPYIPS